MRERSEGDSALVRTGMRIQIQRMSEAQCEADLDARILVQLRLRATDATDAPGVIS